MKKAQHFFMTKTEARFVETVWKHYMEHGRHDLPWRKTHNPYHILVSEIMLQQTQVDRVLPKYRAFLKAFPTVSMLAAAPLSEVLGMWQGLGYNRRAKFLHSAAKSVVTEYKGRFPKEYPTLLALPGVGSYTASAVMAFAYNAPVVLIETNVRTVFIHHFFKNATSVTDAAILKLVERTLPEGRSREWYAALMDYGTHLKRTVGNQNIKSSTYTKQSRFVGSARQVRGAIMRTLIKEKSALTLLGLEKRMPELDATKVGAQLESLVMEGLIVRTRGRYHLPH
jgi:A/G-specific adenine glycosylase